MRCIWSKLIFALLPTVLVGCGQSHLSPALWIQRHGGVLPATDPREQRLTNASQKLLAACTGKRITVQILASDSVTAYSLSNGDIFVTRGLIDHLDDSELQAVVAHELGHLLGAGHVQTVASLRGCCVDSDREIRADASGVELLREEGLSPEAMMSMLEKVKRFGSLPPSGIAAIDHRISVLLAAASGH